MLLIIAPIKNMLEINLTIKIENNIKEMFLPRFVESQFKSIEFEPCSGKGHRLLALLYYSISCCLI